MGHQRDISVLYNSYKFHLIKASIILLFIIFLRILFDSMNNTPPPSNSIFPYDIMRSGQRDFYNDVRRASAEGKILLANAPAGIGKTAASLSGVLENALPAGRKVIFLTNRNSHHIQAMIEGCAINEKRKVQLAQLRESCPRLRIIDKISKQRMCLLHARDPSSPYLVCEITHCKYSHPKQTIIDALLENPINASDNVHRSLAENYCAHYAAFGAIQNSDVIICDYTYLFEKSINELFLTRLGKPLSECDIIIDEAHNLPGRIMDINTQQIDEKTIKNALHTFSNAKKQSECAPEIFAQINLVSGYLKNVLSPELRKLADAVNVEEEINLNKENLKMFLPEKFASYGLSTIFGEKNTALSKMICEIYDFLKLNSMKNAIDIEGLPNLSEFALFLQSAELAAAGNSAYGVLLKSSRDKQFFSMCTMLFDPSLISKRVFSEVHSAILMSGTLLGKKGICDLLGIDENCVIGLKKGAYVSPFDANKQRIKICKCVSSRQRERVDGKGVKLMAAIIEEAARACAPHSLAIFYPSYEYLRIVKDELVLSGFMHEIEIRGEKHTAVEERKIRIETRGFAENAIVFHGVIGGSYSEGMDFRNNPFKLIILAGFPFPKPNARHIAYESYLEKKFGDRKYAIELASILPTSIKTAQALGRGIRKIEDWCYCLLIDDRFAYYQNYFQSSLHGKAEALNINEKNEIWKDIYKFMNEMNKKGEL